MNKTITKTKQSATKEYVDYDILAKQIKDIDFAVLFGERSNGKTYGALKYAIENYYKTGKQFVYIRRWDTDVKASKMKLLFTPLIEDGVIYKASNTEDRGVIYKGGTFYVYHLNENDDVEYDESDAIGYVLSLSQVEHSKSVPYTNVTTVIFDEFIAMQVYLPDEFVTFMNILSTVIRRRTDVKVLMLGNTINYINPYFREMGLEHVREMKAGDMHMYEDAITKRHILVWYTDSIYTNKVSPSDKYYRFDNQQTRMITNGEWQLAMYPHLPEKYKPKDIKFKIFIEFEGVVFQGDCCVVKGNPFLFIHEKTTPIKDVENDFIYSLDHHVSLNYTRLIQKPHNRIGDKIKWLFANDRVYYQDDKVGNYIEQYLRSK